MSPYRTPEELSSVETKGVRLYLKKAPEGHYTLFVQTDDGYDTRAIGIAHPGDRGMNDAVIDIIKKSAYNIAHRLDSDEHRKPVKMRIPPKPRYE